MIDFLMLLACVLTRLFRSRARLEAEILVLRHQLNILQRKSTKRAAFKSIDRLVFAGLYRLVPGVLDALKILKPETVIRVGTGPDSEPIGGGNRDRAVADQRLRWRFVSSFET
jgi:hypothetical protein